MSDHAQEPTPPGSADQVRGWPGSFGAPATDALHEDQKHRDAALSGPGAGPRDRNPPNPLREPKARIACTPLHHVKEPGTGDQALTPEPASPRKNRFPHLRSSLARKPAAAAAGAGWRQGSPPGPAGGAERVRTDDLLLAKQALSQLSYSPARPQPTPGPARPAQPAAAPA
jgi:hypothetical protein